MTRLASGPLEVLDGRSCEDLNAASSLPTPHPPFPGRMACVVAALRPLRHGAEEAPRKASPARGRGRCRKPSPCLFPRKVAQCNLLVFDKLGNCIPPTQVWKALGRAPARSSRLYPSKRLPGRSWPAATLRSVWERSLEQARDKPEHAQTSPKPPNFCGYGISASPLPRTHPGQSPARGCPPPARLGGPG